MKSSKPSINREDLVNEKSELWQSIKNELAEFEALPLDEQRKVVDIRKMERKEALGRDLARLKEETAELVRKVAG